jgi:prepilin peptidase CpaA
MTPWLADVMAAMSVGLLLVAALADITARIIPDSIAVGVAVLGIAGRSLAGLPGLAASVAAALLLFVALLFLHARGLMGGGDVKLATATSLGLPIDLTYRFVVVTALAGGLLALIYIVLRRLVRDAPRPPARGAWLVRRVLAAEHWRIARRGSLPYGVAIASGGICAILASRGG